MDFLFVFLRIYLIEKNKVSENDRLLLALVQKWMKMGNPTKYESRFLFLEKNAFLLFIISFTFRIVQLCTYKLLYTNTSKV